MRKFNFTVKSSIKNYDVIFDTFENTIDIKDGDCVIIDSNIKLDIKCDNIITIDSDETMKEYSHIFNIINEIVDNGFKRNNRLIAIGGGVVQDITGFISSILYRGVDWVFYPTTLLAQGDSCIGSKTSINLGKYKNLVGNFYPPSNIVIDGDFLKTLPEKQIMSGIGEMTHYFLIDGKDNFRYINIDNRDNLDEMIYRSLMIKKKMIEIDEFDQNERKVFNYGHSFGHAIETITNYGIPHGIAVSYGMSISNYISYSLGYMNEESLYEMEELLKPIYSYIYLPKIDIDDYIEILKKDKKNVGDDLGLILTRGSGDMFLEQISVDRVYDLINYKIKSLNE
jgi:3-dehydroquinate synthase